MKKILSIILALTFCFAAFSALAPSASAKSATISEREAKELVAKAYEFYCDAIVDSWIDNGNLVDYQSDDAFNIYNSELDRTLLYYPVYESKLPGGSYSEMREVVKEIYTDDLVADDRQISAYSWRKDSDDSYLNDNIFVPIYHVAENGKVYAQGLKDYADYSVFISATDPGYFYESFDGEIHLKIKSGDSKSATAFIIMGFYHGDSARSQYHGTVECKFENTADGWRIAESEFSVLMASSPLGLSVYRQLNPEETDPDVYKLTDFEAKYIVDGYIADYILERYCNYYQNYVDYAKSSQKEVKEIVKEITASDGSKHTMRYVEYQPGIYFLDDAWEYYLDNDFVKEHVLKAYRDNEFDMFITEGGTEYIAVLDEDDLLFVYDRDKAVVEVIESTDTEATARVYCGLKKDGKVIPIYVECKFERFDTLIQWNLADSAFVDMVTSVDGFEYTVGEAPPTGDNAFDTIALCLGGIAIIMSAICLVCRKREIL
ncbi:MAG: hypothetical protein IKK74_11640 [Clostridia bacterium]|nr:hypothetical protein [Clostridia bacterium]